jgi:hypothetical protein
MGHTILLFLSSQKPGAGMGGECIGVAYVTAMLHARQAAVQRSWSHPHGEAPQKNIAPAVR